MQKRQLKHSLTLNFIFVALFPLITLSFIVALHLAYSSQKELEKSHHILAETVGIQVEAFLKEPRIILENIGEMLAAKTIFENAQVQKVLDLHIKNSKLFESIFLMNNDGIVTEVGLPSGRKKFYSEYIGINLGHLPFVASAKTEKKTTWSNTFLSVTSGDVSLALCHPLDELSLIGNLRIDVLSKFVENLNENHNIQVSLIDQNGTIIIHPDPLLGATQVNVNNLIIVQEGFTGKEGATKYTFNNIKYIGSTKNISEPKWLVLVSEPLSSAYQGIKVIFIYFIVVALVASLLVTLIAFLKAKKITTPLIEVVHRSEEIANGNYKVSFSGSSYYELSVLTSSIQNMADAVKSREKDLQMSQKRLAEIYNATSEAIFIRDAETFQLLEANKAMTEIFGYELDELKEKSIQEISNGDPKLIEQKVNHIINKTLHGDPQIFEWNYIHKNGAAFWAEVALKKAEIDGQIRILGVLRDITERKGLENQLLQAQKMEAIGTLAGGIAHDFNNILSIILGYSDMALEDAPKGSKYQNDLRKILTAGERAKDLVKQILAFSRQTSAERKPIYLQQITSEIVKMLRASIPTTIDIKNEIDTECKTVLANPAQYQQILMNLCTNASHAMEEKGGTLKVKLKSTYIVQGKKIGLSPGEYVELTVADTGIGIGPDVIDKIFNPFFTTKEAGKGTGMGLSIIHGIVKDYGGTINVESRVGQGTTFYVYFPVCAEEELEMDEEGAVIPLGNERILFVDDEPLITEMGQDLLERLGYQVIIRQSGFEALTTFQNNPDDFDVVITDQTMPGMTGYELARLLLKINPEIPIILCTGYSNLIDEKSAKAIGIKEFALKPLTREIIAKLIRKVLDKPS